MSTSSNRVYKMNSDFSPTIILLHLQWRGVIWSTRNADRRRGDRGGEFCIPIFLIYQNCIKCRSKHLMMQTYFLFQVYAAYLPSLFTRGCYFLKELCKNARGALRRWTVYCFVSPNFNSSTLELRHSNSSVFILASLSWLIIYFSGYLWQ